MPGTLKILIVGPTSEPWESVAPDVEADLARLERPGVELDYRCTGEGPAEIHSAHDARLAAPFVVKTILGAVNEGFDGIIVDCTADPGVAEARELVQIPVVGAGEALRSAMVEATPPVVELTGDDLRGLEVSELVASLRDAATVALGGTGFSRFVQILSAANPRLAVLDPLDLALDTCVARIGAR